MLLLDLPIELLIHIATHLPDDKSINSLALCRRNLYRSLNRLLYRHNREVSHNSALIWAAAHDATETIRCAIDAGTVPRLQRLPLLHIAASRGHKHVLRMLVEECKFGLSEWDIDGLTPIIVAVQSRHPEIVKMLLAYGAGPNVTSARGKAPLHVAATIDEAAATMALIAAGANISFPWQGWPPLYMAARSGSAKVVEILLRHGASQTSSILPGWTALSVAVQQGKTEVARLLLQNGADASSVDDVANSMLYLAADKGRVELVKLLIEYGAKPVANVMAGSLPLHAASWFGSVEIVKILLEQGADIHMRCREGMTPLHEAVRRKKVEVARILLDAGADARTVNGHGDEPLHIAAEHDSDGVISLLLEHGADINAKQANKWTPIAVAVDAGCVATTKALLEHGASANDNSANLPLIFCVNTNASAAMFELLLKHGADVHVVDDEGFTAVHNAARYGNVNIMKLLLDAGAELEAVDETLRTPLWIASSNGHVDAVAELVSRGADIEGRNKDGYTPLLAAIECRHDSAASRTGHLKGVEWLIEHGAKMSARNTTGWGPLMCAVQHGDEEVLERVISTGEVDINEADIDGRTPLFRASMLGRIDAVKILLEQTPKPISNTRDRYGATPLIVAARNGHADILALLLTLPDVPLYAIDRFGHSGFYWAARCSVYQVQELLSPYDAKADRNRIGTSRIPQIRYITDTCFCDVCGRCTTGASHGLTHACGECVTGDGLNFLVCAYCRRRGMGCRVRGHRWKGHRCDCVEPMGVVREDDEESESEIESEDEGEDGSWV